MFIVEGLITSIVFNVILCFLCIKYFYAWKRAKERTGIDPLTGLLNRQGLNISANSVYARFRRKKVSCIAVAVIDLDNFKPVNDRYGHKSGDQVLQLFAQQLVSHTRETDIVARYGGDEFALVFADTDAKTVHRIFDRVREKIENYPFPFEDINVSFSVGVKKTSDPNMSFEEILAQADRKCLRRKERGGKKR